MSTRPADKASWPEPATAGQTSLFYAAEKDPSGSSFTTDFTVTVDGPLDRERVRRAAALLTAATPSLRLRLTIDDWTGEVVQSFCDDPLDVEWHTIAEDEVPALVARSDAEPIEADDGPLARLVVAEHGSGRHTVSLVIHHLAMDGLSQIPLLRQLGAALAGRPRHQPVEVYRRAVREVRAAEEAALRDDRDHWYERVPSTLVLADWKTPAVRGAGTGGAPAEAPGCRREALPPEAAKQLAIAATRSGVRVSHLLTAAVHHAAPVRPGGRTAVCNAASVRPRHGELADVIGNFVNEVPLLAAIEPDRSVVDTARSHRQRWSKDLRKRTFPFATLATRIPPPRPGRAPALDSVVMSYRRLPRGIGWEDGGLSFSSSLYSRYPTAKTEIAVRFFHDGDELEYEVQWGRNLPAGAGEEFRVRLAAALRTL
ncbi:condensation domain-containing protein [Streptomyces spinosus]|uniref:condensation domain-containing protein n=1 Tax=Streptomyces spinosus TaxID=2872623 RepID=UPI001CEDA40A|nr:condensation domain-containing protein [Streptomyces spinosus]